jgi:hypothetical protein
MKILAKFDVCRNIFYSSISACIYYSLPDDDKTCAKPNVTVVSKKNLFCPGECMQLANGCLNLDKYRHLNESVNYREQSDSGAYAHHVVLKTLIT